MKITFNGMARFGLPGVLQKQYKDVDDAEFFGGMMRKIRLPKQMQDQIITIYPNGNSSFDIHAFESLEHGSDEHMDLDALKIGKIITRMEEFVKDTGISPSDGMWLPQLLRTLKAAQTSLTSPAASQAKKKHEQ